MRDVLILYYQIVTETNKSSDIVFEKSAVYRNVYGAFCLIEINFQCLTGKENKQNNEGRF